MKEPGASNGSRGTKSKKQTTIGRSACDTSAGSKESLRSQASAVRINQGGQQGIRNERKTFSDLA
jgi:hypothetical protein